MDEFACLSWLAWWCGGASRRAGHHGCRWLRRLIVGARWGCEASSAG